MSKKSNKKNIGFAYVSFDKILTLIKNDEFKELDILFEDNKRDALLKNYGSFLIGKSMSVEMVKFFSGLMKKVKFLGNPKGISPLVVADSLEIARELIKAGFDPMHIHPESRNNILHFGPEPHTIQAIMENLTPQQQDVLLKGKNAKGLIPVQCNVLVRGDSLKKILSYRDKNFYKDVKFTELIFTQDAKMLFDFGIPKCNMSTYKGESLISKPVEEVKHSVEVIGT